MVNSSEGSSHTDGTKISHPRWDEKIPREGFPNPYGGTKRSQGRDETIPTEGFPPPHEGKENAPRGDEIKLRRNEMKLRRNEIKVRKNYFVATWKIKSSHVESPNFPRGYCLWASARRAISLRGVSLDRLDCACLLLFRLFLVGDLAIV